MPDDASQAAQASGAGSRSGAAADRAEHRMYFILDGLATGPMVRILSVVDAYTRECLALEADTSLGSGRVSLQRRIKVRQHIRWKNHSQRVQDG